MAKLQLTAAMSAKTYLITGASRGVGLELCKQLAARPDTRVVAAARRPEQAAELQALAQQAGSSRVEVVQLDTASAASIQTCVDGLKQTLGHIDVVVNNAGISDSRAPFDQVTEQELLDCFQTNTIGPFLFTQALKRAGLIGAPGGTSVVANISSILGSNGTDVFAAYPGYAYRMSKAALNSMTRYVDIALAPEGISLVAIHPGYVKTDINQGAGDITAEESVRGILQVLEGGKDLHGRFYSWAGDELPW